MGPATVVLWLCVASLLVTAYAAPKDSVCSESGKSCTNNGECCGGCCQDGKCVANSDACASGAKPCQLHECPPNKECYLQSVQCLQSPCLPIPACKSVDSDYDYPN